MFFLLELDMRCCRRKFKEGKKYLHYANFRCLEYLSNSCTYPGDIETETLYKQQKCQPNINQMWELYLENHIYLETVTTELEDSCQNLEVNLMECPDHLSW